MAGNRWKDILCFIAVGAGIFGLAGGYSVVKAQFSTEDHASSPGFWPTQLNYPRAAYAGPQACAGCHEDIYASQIATPMATTAERASASGLPLLHNGQTFSRSPYVWMLRSDAAHKTYSVSNGQNSESATIDWAFGGGRVAQSYLFKKKDGNYYEARVTYFDLLGGLNFTPGRALESPHDVDEAMGRQVPQHELDHCFGCHTTAAGMGRSFDEETLIPGVSCEACHGPGAEHTAAMEGTGGAAVGTGGNAAGSHEKNAIFNPARLSPSDSVDYCGACHGSSIDVSLSQATGVATVLFPPYRLEESKCWGTKGDARLTCIRCHDPHKQLETNPIAYDHVCLSCHVTKDEAAGSQPAEPQPVADHPGAACPVAQKKCVTCHMPGVYLPDMHQSFPDHRIRVARADEPYPE